MDDRRTADGAGEVPYIGSYVWTDAHGEQGMVDIHAAAHADPPVQVRTCDGAASMIAAVDDVGQPVWSADVLAALGMDTAAARNDLIEITRQTYLGLSGTD